MDEFIDDEMRELVGEYLDKGAKGSVERAEVIEELALWLMASAMLIVLAADGVRLPPASQAAVCQLAKQLRRGR